MGFLRSTLRVVTDVTSLGGTYRVRKWTEKKNWLMEVHAAICSQIDEADQELLRAIAEVEACVRAATRRLRAASKILDPYRQLSENPKVPLQGAALIKRPRPELSNAHLPIRDEVGFLATGAAAGAGSTAGAWGIVQILGHASTGTAMGVIHGAAASNAGWAWFGGGSLATGGLGMAGGHLILPGIGTAVAVTVSSTLAHKEANRISAECAEIDAANDTNSAALVKLQSDHLKVSRLADKLKAEYARLDEAVHLARRKLFPKGPLSQWYRFLRVFLGGYYYRSQEFGAIEDLNTAVNEFLSAVEDIR